MVQAKYEGLGHQEGLDAMPPSYGEFQAAGGFDGIPKSNGDSVPIDAPPPNIGYVQQAGSML